MRSRMRMTTADRVETAEVRRAAVDLPEPAAGSGCGDTLPLEIASTDGTVQHHRRRLSTHLRIVLPVVFSGAIINVLAEELSSVWGVGLTVGALGACLVVERLIGMTASHRAQATTGQATRQVIVVRVQDSAPRAQANRELKRLVLAAASAAAAAPGRRRDPLTLRIIGPEVEVRYSLG